MNQARLHPLGVVQGVAIWTSFAEALTESLLETWQLLFLNFLGDNDTILHIPLSFIDLATITV
jgi:hypothetical protein